MEENYVYCIGSQQNKHKLFEQQIHEIIQVQIRIWLIALPWVFEIIDKTYVLLKKI